jgi:hypothetical protein
MAWTFSYNGLAFGEGTDINVVSVEGLDLPEVRSNDSDRPQLDGQFPGRDLLSGRAVTIELEVFGSATAQRTTLDAIRSAFAPRQDELTLAFQLPGYPTQRVQCRPRRRAMRIDQSYALGVASVSVQLWATDPLIYATATQSLVAAMASTTGGLGFPHGFPHGFGTVVSGSVFAINGGGAPTAPLATINASSALTNPRIENVTTGAFIEAITTLAAGDALAFDFAARAVTLNGTTSRTGAVRRPVSSWFMLRPGTTEVRFSAAAGSGTLNLAWSDAWY